MEMTIEDAIKRIDNIMFTKFTTVKDEDAFLTAIETMRKYRQIEQIYKEWFSDKDRTSADAYVRIGEVVEDGNDAR